MITRHYFTMMAVVNLSCFFMSLPQSFLQPEHKKAYKVVL
jgi:hypothetical protein